MNIERDREIAKLFAKNFIARSDVKAIQRSSGAYNPDVRRTDSGEAIIHEASGFKMQDLLNHISGNATYGHYLLGKDEKCKLFVFDIDLDQPDPRYPETYDQLVLPTSFDGEVYGNFYPSNPREDWRNRSLALQRNYLKTQLRMMAEILASTASRELDIPVAAAYTGNKGVHVYGFTGSMPAHDVREGAQMILDLLDCFAPSRGNNFFKHKAVTDANGCINEELSYQCLTVEVFPKQISLSEGGFGNLCRLPLGKNLKNPADPTFFLDFRTNLGSQALTPRDALDALTTTSYWK